MKIKYFIIAVIVLVFLGTCSKFVIPSFGEYSTGERSGIVQKMTSKGMFVKTNEGELALEGIKSSNSKVSSTFEFSVKDQVVADSLVSYIGSRVKIFYTEYYHSWVFDGETNYRITKVELLK